MNRVFLDTNVLCYPHDASAPAKRAKASSLLAGLIQPQYEPVISTQVLQEFYNVLTRKLGFSPQAAKRELQLLEPVETVLITPSIIQNAADLQVSHSISFWDALIVAAAQSGQCNELWTEDLHAGQMFGTLKIVNPLV